MGLGDEGREFKIKKRRIGKGRIKVTERKE